MGKATIMKVGVTDAYVATATVGENGVMTYGTPEVYGGTASISVSQTTGNNTVYESDVMIRNNNRISGANITYNSRTVNMDEEMKILYGKTASGSSKEFEDGPDDLAPTVAFGFAAKMSDGSYKCYWYYNCTGSKGDESFETATDTESSPEDSYTFAAMPATDTGKLRRRKLCANETEMRAFFASVKPSA